MSECRYCGRATDLHGGDYHGGCIRLHVAELEAKVERMKDALTAISTALDAYGVDYCRGTAKAALESSDEL